jgi:hypothetical protein
MRPRADIASFIKRPVSVGAPKAMAIEPLHRRFTAKRTVQYARRPRPQACPTPTRSRRRDGLVQYDIENYVDATPVGLVHESREFAFRTRERTVRRKRS